MPLRLGMLGMWHVHATGIVRQIATHRDEFELVACYDADTAVVAQRQTDWAPILGPLPIVSSAAELLRQPLDGIVVEGRVFENVALAQQAVEAGHSVLLEKPAGVNLADFERLASSARQRGLHVQLIYLFRYMSAVRELMSRAQRGDFGQLYEFRGRLPKDLRDYARNEAELGHYAGGIYFEMAGHLIDFLVALLGPPRRISSALAHHHAVSGSFVDNGVAWFECERGIGIVEVPALEIVPDQRRIELYGTLGAAVIPHLGSGHLSNQTTQPLDVYSAASGRWERLDIPAATLQIADLREFAAVVRGQKQPDYSLDHDRIVQQALVESAGMTRTVSS